MEPQDYMFSSTDWHLIFCQDIHFYSKPFTANHTNKILIVESNATNKGGLKDCCGNLLITHITEDSINKYKC